MDNATRLLVEAAEEILAYVSDPGEPPPLGMTMTMEYRHPRSEAQLAREKADRLESQSRAVRRLKAAISAVKATRDEDR